MKTYNIKVNGKAFEVTIDSIDENGIASISVNGNDYKVEVSGDNAPKKVIAAAPTVVAPSAVTPSACAVAPSGPVAAPAAPAGGCDVFAHLPGVIIAVNVNVGDTVAQGQSVATLEAMKMENAIEAECAGVIKAIHVQKGDSVLEGAKIVTIG